ncbi:hypothetical protein MRS44_013156 [Fusarium solani]|uniref:uncharacterized protein n=1 Tax=Fusarium solani TaxID=169388 RepID=UPI0032C43811|nr:hypothetical protein MRS44_013156 [Fusarium solani]
MFLLEDLRRDDDESRRVREPLVLVREKIVATFEQHKQKVIEALSKAPGLVHMSFDGWRSGNRYALYAPGTLPNIAAEILDIIESYQIQDKVGYFTLDNAKNNDTAMEIIGGELGFVRARRRGRCFGHTLNLSAKAVLFGHDADAFERRISGAEPLTEAEHLIWRKKGPAGKLHNLVVAIHRSDLLTGMLRNIQQEAFKSTDPKLKARKPLDVILDNDTRWLPQLYMIRLARLIQSLPPIFTMQFFTLASVLAMAAAVTAAPALGLLILGGDEGSGRAGIPGGSNNGNTTTTTTNKVCSVENQQVCCTGLLACAVQVLGEECKGGNAYRCNTGAATGTLINIALANCVDILQTARPDFTSHFRRKMGGG